MLIRRNIYQLLSLAFLFFFYTSQAQANIVNSVKDGSWNDPTVWDSGIPGINDSVYIDGHLIEANNLTISVSRIHLTNDSGTNAKLSLLGTTRIEVAGEFYVQGEGRSVDVIVYLETDAELEVNGLLNFQRLASNTDDFKVQLYLKNKAKVYAKNGFTFEYHNSGGGENSPEIVLYNESLLDVTGNTQFYNHNGTEFSVATYWMSNIILRNEFTAQLNTGGAMLFEANEYSRIRVKGDAYVNNTGGSGDIDFVLNTAGNIYFEENLDLSASLSGKKVWFTASHAFCNIYVSKNIIFNTFHNQTIGITLLSFSDLYIGGNFVRTNGYGSLDMTDDAILFLDGSVVQTIPAAAGAGTDSINITNLNLNNTADSVILEGPLVVSKNLELVDGIIFSSDANPVIVNDQVEITGGSKTAYIDGPVIKTGRNNGNPFTFPVGDNGVYAPVTTSAVSNSLSEYTVEYSRSSPPAGTLIGGISAVSDLEYWVFDTEPGSESVSVTLAWDNATTSSIQDTSDLVMSRHDDATGEWINIGASLITGGDAPGQAGTITHDLGCPPPCCHSILTFGTLSPSNALPVDLQSFSAKLQGEEVLLHWTTSDEINMEKFEIERSTDGINFQSILETPSKGQLGFSIYQSRDDAPSVGNNYYRLKMVDFQGIIEHSEVVSIYFKVLHEWQAYPNPVSDNFQLQGINLPEGNTKIEVLNQVGQQVFTGQFDLDGQATSLSAKDLNIELPGLYRIYFSQADKNAMVNIVKR